jgi:hypothetical protein
MNLFCYKTRLIPTEPLLKSLCVRVYKCNNSKTAERIFMKFNTGNFY